MSFESLAKSITLVLVLLTVITLTGCIDTITDEAMQQKAELEFGKYIPKLENVTNKSCILDVSNVKTTDVDNEYANVFYFCSNSTHECKYSMNRDRTKFVLHGCNEMF